VIKAYLIGTKSAISPAVREELASNLLGESSRMHIIGKPNESLGTDRDRGSINALGSIVASLLYRQHPAKKPYEDWRVHHVDLFRGHPIDGTTLNHLDGTGEDCSESDRQTLTYAYAPIIGGATLGENFSDVNGEVCVLPGGAIIIAALAMAHTIHIQPEGVTMRMALV
jgi:hypothetical protein